MKHLTVAGLAGICGGTVSGNPARVIGQICTDSRRIDLAEECLFIALTGPSHNGHRFLYECWQSGIRAFLVSELPDLPDRFGDSSFILVGDTLAALQAIATSHRSQFGGQVIAITGSNGKTIIKEWLSQIMQRFWHVTRSPKSYNSQVGVPLSVLNIRGNEEFAVLEAGISKPGEMKLLESVLKPDLGIITNIGDAHQENFDSTDAKIREKLILFGHCRKVYYCRDHRAIHEQIVAGGLEGRCSAWSRSQPARLFISEESVAGGKATVKARFDDRTVTMTIPFSDAASVENIIHIWLILLDLGMPQETIQQGVAELEPVSMRLEQKAGINGCTLINDFYNSDIQSLKIALDLLIQQTPQSRKTLILSDILQSGLPEQDLYRQVAGLLGQKNLHRLIGIGPAITRNRSAFSGRVETWPSTGAFLGENGPDEFRDEAVLLKGARAFAFERISNVLEARTHSTKLEISMNDTRFNLEQYRRLTGPGVKVMAMVKAFSYGSGGIEMARFLANERIDYLGVAFVDEGIDIRRAGIRTPVMVMNADLHQAAQLIEYHLEPEIYGWKGLESFAREVRAQGMGPYPIHLKIDTGMHRLGFNHGEAVRLSEYLLEHPEIFPRSIFSHLAASEDPESDGFTRLQIKRFTDACHQVRERTGVQFLRHLLNSAGIERFPDAHFDMVRLGIGLYGFGNPGGITLRPVATLKTVISQVHQVPAGESVGYGTRAVVSQPSRIGVIPVGYADGIDRRLGNGNYRMHCSGHRVPTIGNICMDMTLLDLTGTGCGEGDQVVVFGRENPVSLMAAVLGTIPYEVITSISPRVKRIYLFD